jgi:uncharacterized protein YhaN
VTERLDLRLVRLRVEGFGRLRDFSFQPASHPGSIVLAPNEAGKSTLASAIVRGLFGFRDKEDEAARSPWAGGPFRVQQEWVLGGRTRCVIARNFETQSVVVEWHQLDEATGQISIEGRWEGQPNPRGRSVDREQYETELRRLLGFATPEVFLQTAYVGPGGLTVRPIETELLRLLSGSERADFRAAMEALEAGYYRLTQADITDPSRVTKQKPRQLEALAADRRDTIRRQADVKRARAARDQLETALATDRSRLAEIEAEREARAVVEKAIRRLREIRQEEERAQRRRDELEQAISRITDWEAGVREKTKELQPLVGYLRQEADFATQLGDLRRLAKERDHALEELGVARDETSPRARQLKFLGVAGGVVLVGGVVGIVAGGSVGLFGAVTVAGLLVLSAYGWSVRYQRAKIHELEESERAIKTRAGRLEARRRAIAESTSLDPDAVDIDVERERYDRAQQLKSELDGMQQARAALGDHQALDQERREIGEKELDVLRLERRRILEEHPFLEGDEQFEPRFATERRRLEEERKELVERELEHRRKLADLPPAQDDPRELEARVQELDETAERIAIDRDAHRLAYTTLATCRDEFVTIMTGRLEGRIGELFGELTDGRYRGVTIDPRSFEVAVAGVEKVEVGAASLSRGARDQLYFAMRVAVVEIMAADRALPLILDDPFLHFDDRRLARVERMLERVGTTHQIILLTHDARLSDWSFPSVRLPALVAPSDSGLSTD